jgi:hypothetical protein
MKTIKRKITLMQTHGVVAPVAPPPVQNDTTNTQATNKTVSKLQEAVALKKGKTETSKADLQAELEKKFDELFGSVN